MFKARQNFTQPVRWLTGQRLVNRKGIGNIIGKIIRLPDNACMKKLIVTKYKVEVRPNEL